MHEIVPYEIAGRHNKVSLLKYCLRIGPLAGDVANMHSPFGERRTVSNYTLNPAEFTRNHSLHC